MKDILEIADENFESKKWVRSGNYAVKNPDYQPERLSEKTFYNNEDEIRLEEIHFPYE